MTHARLKPLIPTFRTQFSRTLDREQRRVQFTTRTRLIRPFTSSQAHSSYSHKTSPNQNEHLRRFSPLTIIALSAGALILLYIQPHRPPTLNDAPNSSQNTNNLSSAQHKSPDDDQDNEMALSIFAAYSPTAKLRAQELSMTFSTSDGGSNVNASRFDSACVPSNSPCEDHRSYSLIDTGDGEKWQVWGVFDGHSGEKNSFNLQQNLPLHISRSLSLTRARQSSLLEDSAIDEAIKRSFTKFDSDIMNEGRRALGDTTLGYTEMRDKVALAQSGSCALVALFNPKNALLKVACVGDSRAVLGRKQQKTSPTSPTSSAASSSISAPPASPTTMQANVYPGPPAPSDHPTEIQYTAIPLSQDQTGFNQDEVSRITALHPNEPEILSPTTGRLLGLAVTRAFGDHRWKWPQEAIQRSQAMFQGPAPRPNYATPPYLTAEPVITSTKIQKGDFLILASDGFWDHVENDLAVLIVEKWLERKRGLAQGQAQKRKMPTPLKKMNENQVPFSWAYRASKETITVEEENAATCLARNALGGSDYELFRNALSVKPPESRSVRDDITVTVVFFAEEI